MSDETKAPQGGRKYDEESKTPVFLTAENLKPFISIALTENYEVDAAVAAALEQAAQVVLMDSCDKPGCDIPAHQKAQKRAAQIRGLITPMTTPLTPERDREILAAVAAFKEQVVDYVRIQIEEYDHPIGCSAAGARKATWIAEHIAKMPANDAALTALLRRERLEEAKIIAGMECRRCLGGDSPTSLDFDNFFHTDGTLCEAQWANERLAALREPAVARQDVP